MNYLYKHLVYASPIGYAYYKIINSSQGSPIDYIYMEMNRSFEKLIGISANEIIGKKGTEVLGEVDYQLLEVLKARPYEIKNDWDGEIETTQNGFDQPLRMKVDFWGDGFFITEIQKDLVEIEDSFRLMFETAPIGMASISLDGMFRDVNDLFCKILGYEKEVLIKMGFDELTYIEDKNVSNMNFQRLKDNKQSTVKLEKRYLNREGEIIWVDLSARLMSDSEGVPIRIVITIVDITNRKNVEEQLQKSEEKYKMLFNETPLGYQSLDIDDYLTEVNEQWAQILGYSREEVLGKWFGDFISPSYIDEFKTSLPLFKKQGYINSKFVMLHKNGSNLYIDFDGKIGYDQNGKFKQSHCTLKDITKQWELERELSENRHLMNSLMANTPDPVYIKNTEGKYLFFNKAAEKFSGKKASDILGKGVEAVFPLHVAQELTARDNEIFDKKDIITSEEKVLGTLGNFNTFLSTKGPIFDENHKLLGMFGISRDITERKQREEELRVSERKYRLITENTADVITVYNNTQGQFTFISPSVINLRGFSIEEAMTQVPKEIVVPEAYKSFEKTIEKNMKEFINKPNLNNHYTIEVQIFHKNGKKVWTEISTRYQYNGLKEIESVSILRNIEERKKSEEIMLQLSYYDQLTGLYNRRFYEEELNRLDIERNLPISLIMADLNGLKLTNDAFGHQEGDLRLKKIAKILSKECRADEIISRIGGDEFVILMPNTKAEDVRNLIKRINEAVKNEKVEHGILSLSIGFAVKEKVSDKIHEIFKKAEDDMYRHKLAESSSMKSKTINLIMNSLYEKSQKEALHSNRVSMICIAIAAEMHFNQEEINQTKIAGLVHDIGKIGISNVILDKPGKLTSDEWGEIKKHCEVGYRILSSVNEFSEIAESVLSHQERWDGKGYPQGLKGEDIPIQSRIIAVADAFDAMTSDRTYRLGISEAEAVVEIRKCAGTQFDPDIARIFVEQVLPNMANKFENVEDLEG